MVAELSSIDRSNCLSGCDWQRLAIKDIRAALGMSAQTTRHYAYSSANSNASSDGDERGHIDVITFDRSARNACKI